MIVSICGYNCSGSSAVLDLLKEYEEAIVIDFECMLLDFPDGIRSLDQNVNSAGLYFREDLAFTRFKKFVHNNRYIQKFSNYNADKITQRYIQDLTGVSWQGRSVYDYMTKDCIEKNYWLVKRMVEKAVYKLLKKRIGFTNRLMRMRDKDVDFYSRTREYIDELIVSFGGDLSKINVMDQLMPPIAASTFFKYVNDGCAIIVDRDPRDMFLNLNMGVDCECVPRNGNDFVKYHKLWWGNRENCDKVLYIMFDDLIYKYDETLKKIEQFLGIKNHIRKKQYFKPEKSINNTQIFKRVKGFGEEIRLIENELQEYLYDYSQRELVGLSDTYKYIKKGIEN